MNQCPHCGQAKQFIPPHEYTTCPVLMAEHEQRMRHAEIEHQARIMAMPLVARPKETA